jgi:hypothetical protein
MGDIVAILQSIIGTVWDIVLELLAAVGLEGPALWGVIGVLLLMGGGMWFWKAQPGKTQMAIVLGLIVAVFALLATR